MGKLTVRTIENAKPKDKAYKLIDGEGLQMRVATDGKKTWLVRYVIHGVERQYRLPELYRQAGGPGFCSLQDAREEAAKIRALARQGIDYPIQLEHDLKVEEQSRQEERMRLTALAKAEQTENLSFQDLFNAWLQDGVRRKDGNAELRRSFQADVLPKLGATPIKQLTEHDLRSVLRTMVERGVNRAAVVMRNNLTQMFAWAEKRQPWRKLLADGNPMDLIEISKIVERDYNLNNQRDRVLSANEIRELRDIFSRMQHAYENAPNRRIAVQPVERTVQCAIWIMISTLCRVGELSMARWEHVDLEKRQWFIPKENVKGNLSNLTVFLSDFALHEFFILRSITANSEWCFPARNKDSHLCVKSISKQIGDRQVLFKNGKDGCLRKPLKNRRNDNTLVLSNGKTGAWTPHDLRRTGATLMQALKIPFDTIDRCQNHVLHGSKVRRHYMHHDYATEKYEAWNLLGKHLEMVLQVTDDMGFLP